MIEAFSLPLSSPLSTASGTIDRREGFLVRQVRHGVTGIGEATPLPGWTESRSACRDALERAQDATAERQGTGFRAVEGTPAARHGFATARLDAQARTEGRPLYRWLADGGSCQRVPVNATLGDGDVDQTVGAAERLANAGFDCLKLKVGARPLEADLERVRTVRTAVGDDVTLRLDANGSWGRDGAREAFDALADIGVSYVEQPLAPHDIAGHEALRGGQIGVAVDETLSERPIGAVLDAGAADVVILKPMVLGGPGTAYTLAGRAREAGVEPVVTTTVDAVVARTAAVHVAAAVAGVRACGLATADRLEADLGPDPAPVTDGSIAVPQGPGLGIDPTAVSP
jgi:o-succinylbenzoate synthase